MDSLLQSVYELSDSTYASRISAVSVHGVLPAYLAEMNLATALARITSLCHDGLPSFDDIPAVLGQINYTILELMAHCIRVPRDSYHEYLLVLSGKFRLFLARIVQPTLETCVGHARSAKCFHVVRAVSDIVVLAYTFISPLQGPQFFGRKGQNTDGFRETDLLSATRRLHDCIAQIVSANPGKCLRNETPRRLFRQEATDALAALTKISIAVVNNCMPCRETFEYFRSRVDHDPELVDFEYFEEYLAHMAKVDVLVQKSPILEWYFAEKAKVDEPFVDFLRLFPEQRIAWCTPVQMANHQQIFVDLYNEIYGCDICLERVFFSDTGRESTVLRHGWEPEAPNASLDSRRGSYESVRRSTPAFVEYFEPPPDNSSLPRTHAPPPSLRSSGSEHSGASTRAPKYYGPRHPAFMQIYDLNEMVAAEVKDARASLEKLAVDKVQLRARRCYKCKFLPWHRHSH